MSDLTLVIGNKNYSSWSLRPWVLLRYFEIPFKEILIPLRQADSREKVLQYSRLGKVPVLLDGKITVWESLAICEYVAEIFPQKALWPKDSASRARARVVSGEMYSGFLGLRKQFPQNISADLSGKPSNEDADRDIQRVVEIWEDCRRDFQNEGPFLFGAFSIADAMYAPVVYRFKTYGIQLTGLASEYKEMMLSLPAMKEWHVAAAKEEFSW
ncbi:MAG: glutathione S-transferase family protein [Candidatus Omnitrophica bacterium]|nr:glutathione S-transferase family protein [Candidatus Omnitrophota bacterium]